MFFFMLHSEKNKRDNCPGDEKTNSKLLTFQKRREIKLYVKYVIFFF